MTQRLWGTRVHTAKLRIGHTLFVLSFWSDEGLSKFDEELCWRAHLLRSVPTMPRLSAVFCAALVGVWGVVGTQGHIWSAVTSFVNIPKIEQTKVEDLSLIHI